VQIEGDVGRGIQIGISEGFSSIGHDSLAKRTHDKISERHQIGVNEMM
jgi:hypothetical protein